MTLWAEALMSEDDGPLFLVDLVDRPDWMRDALCREYDEVEFFPSRGEDIRPAKNVCAGCLVRGECFAYAMAEGITYGVWGGMSYKERRRLRREAA